MRHRRRRDPSLGGTVRGPRRRQARQKAVPVLRARPPAGRRRPRPPSSRRADGWPDRRGRGATRPASPQNPTAAATLRSLRHPHPAPPLHRGVRRRGRRAVMGDPPSAETRRGFASSRRAPPEGRRGSASRTEAAFPTPPSPPPHAHAPIFYPLFKCHDRLAISRPAPCRAARAGGLGARPAPPPPLRRHFLPLSRPPAEACRARCTL